MTVGDIVLVYTDSLEGAIPYIAYDKYIAIGAGWKGINVCPVKTFLYDKEHVAVFTLGEPASAGKKRRMADFILKVISGIEQVSFSERTHWLQYIVALYREIYAAELIEHSSIPVTPEYMAQSPLLIKENDDERYYKF